MTRKRPAPGTAPASQPQPGLVPAYATANPGAQLSNDQFLQWGQNPPPSAINASTYTDPSTYNPATFAASQDPTAPAVPAAPGPANQLARRQAQNQLVTRNRGYEQAPTVYAENTPDAGGESATWGESLEELYQRALAAKSDAKAKRKQIPPFVQKLSRYVEIMIHHKLRGY